MRKDFEDFKAMYLIKILKRYSGCKKTERLR